MPKKKVKNALRSAIHAKYDAGARAFSNIPYADILHVNGLNVYDIMNSYKIIFLKNSLPMVEKATGVAVEGA